MNKIKFTIRPYRSSDRTINPDWINVCLVDDEGTVLAYQDMPKHNWAENTNDCRIYWKRTLLTQVKDRLISDFEASRGGYIYKEETRLIVEDNIYDDWFKYYYYIDGENAYQFISACGHSQHNLNWQSRCGVIAGWTFFKVLKKHGFKTDTAAMLAYARGYLAGMESNNPWDSEGMEALQCLGLSIEGGSKALRTW